MPEENVRDKMSVVWADELDVLKSILATTPLEETVKWGAPAYTHMGKNIIGLAAFKNYVGMWFHNGCFINDEAGKFFNSEENAGKAIRQWRFASKQEILDNEKQILDYVNQAIANSEAGLVKKPQPKSLITSETLQNALNADAVLAARFKTFSPSCQREFIEHIESAKRQETRDSRLQKILPMILNGNGLNDKYRK